MATQAFKPSETREADFDKEFVYAQFDFWLDEAEAEGYTLQQASEIAALAIGKWNESE